MYNKKRCHSESDLKECQHFKGQNFVKFPTFPYLVKNI